MPRPRLLLSAAQLDTYTDAGSLRRAAKILGISRWTVGQRLRESGHSVRSREEAQDTIRLYDEIEEDKQAASQCAWPNCPDSRVHGFGLCEAHLARIPEYAKACVMCGRDSMGHGTCYRCDKKMKGLL